MIPVQPEKIKDLAEEDDDECEVYEDEEEDFVTVSSSLAPGVSETGLQLIEYLKTVLRLATTLLLYFVLFSCKWNRVLLPSGTLISDPGERRNRFSQEKGLFTSIPKAANGVPNNAEFA